MPFSLLISLSLFIILSLKIHVFPDFILNFAFLFILALLYACLSLILLHTSFHYPQPILLSFYFSHFWHYFSPSLYSRFCEYNFYYCRVFSFLHILPQLYTHFLIFYSKTSINDNYFKNVQQNVHFITR